MFNFVLDQLRVVAVACTGGAEFLGLPHWYKYVCGHDFRIPQDIPLVGLAIMEMLLRIAAFVSIGYVVFGAVKYQISQGDPGKVGEAKGTVINALVGLVIATLAIAIVAFLGNRLG